MKEQILHLVRAANRHGSERNAFEFLTGRPLAANESYGDWFEKQLEAQGGELSDAQVFIPCSSGRTPNGSGRRGSRLACR